LTLIIKKLFLKNISMKKKLYHSLLLTFLVFVFQSNLKAQCSGGTSFGSVDVSIGGTQTISSCNYAGEFSTVTNIVSGTSYTVTMSGTSYITVHSGSSSGPVISNGNSPLIFTATSSGTYYIVWTRNAACATDATCHTTTIAGPVPPPPAPANDNPTGAIAIVPSASCSYTNYNNRCNSNYMRNNTCPWLR
jgi:hypothetical protein